MNTAKPLIPQLVATGKITRGYLGVNIQTVTPDLAKALKMEGRQGALVSDVVSGSPAEKGGIKRGDIIVDYNGKEVNDSHELPALVAATPVNEEVSVTVLSDGKALQLPIVVAKLQSDETDIENSAHESKGKWGLQLQNLNDEMGQRFRLQADKGVVVVGVQPDSPAREAGIRQGDVIVEVNRQPVNSVTEVKQNIAKSGDKDNLLLLVQRQNGKFYVPLVTQG